MKNNFDIIIIGSGIDALATGSILVQLANKKVLILERHFTIGGFSNTFKKKATYE